MQGTEDGQGGSQAPPEKGRSWKTVRHKEIKRTWTSPQPCLRISWRRLSEEVSRIRRSQTQGWYPGRDAPSGKGRVLPEGRGQTPRARPQLPSSSRPTPPERGEKRASAGAREGGDTWQLLWRGPREALQEIRIGEKQGRQGDHQTLEEGTGDGDIPRRGRRGSLPGYLHGDTSAGRGIPQ